jgi:hypothetical protein
MTMSISPEWFKRIADAQAITHTFIRGRRYARVRLGAEAGSPGYQFCGDCGCESGQLHIRGCDQERCPRCGGQAISCYCRDPGTSTCRFGH